MKAGHFLLLLIVAGLVGVCSWFVWQGCMPPYDPVVGGAASSTLAIDPLPGAQDPASWEPFMHTNVAMSLTSVQGRSAPALRIDYSLPDGGGDYVGARLHAPLSLPASGRFGFWLRADSPPNDLEIKLVDADGSTFMRLMQNATATSDWHRVEIDLREIRYAWSGTNRLMDPPVRLELAVSRGDGTRRGGSGWVDLEGLSLVGANPRLELMVSQVGFDKASPKRAVLRLVNAPAGWQGLGLPRVRIGPAGWGLRLRKAAVEDRGEHAWGGRYWVANLSGFSRSGTYDLTAELDTPGGVLKVRSYPFQIRRGIVAQRTASSQFHYIRVTRYPTNHPHADPVPGGYIDTEFDIEKWMTTTPTWVWGMARFMRCLPGLCQGAALDELAYAVDFMRAMQDTNSGGVYIGVNKTFDAVWPGDITVETDTAKRVLTRGHGLDINTAYAGAMAEAAMALEQLDPGRSAACLQAAVLAWRWCGTQNPFQTQDLGNWLWASMRLHEATGEATYLDKAREIAERILPRQFTDASLGENGVCGRFFRTDTDKDFKYQYKYVHSVGTELGLLELAEALPVTDPLRARITEAMDLYVRAFLKKTADGTPFNVVGQALERNAATGLFQVYYFALNRTYGAPHGLNCDIMASGLVALRYARLPGQAEYKDLAWEQLQWVLGKNPLGFCMISGIGKTNPYTLTHPWNKGPTLGGLINGVSGDEETGAPSYDASWGSSEYWKPHNAMFLTLVAELEGNPPKGAALDKP
ncbi:MAG: glycoside hydrolase family 9 protein [Verrucomicrobiota bacterium]